jgi:hypothetical protein
MSEHTEGVKEGSRSDRVQLRLKTFASSRRIAPADIAVFYANVAV